MIFIKRTFFLFLIFFLGNFAPQITKKADVLKKERLYYSSKGFALIYTKDIYKDGVVNKKINNEKFSVMHSSLKRNTPIQITNLNNSKTIQTKVTKKANYPKIFNIVLSEKIAQTLSLDINNPYVEILEIKQNKKFVAKKANTYEEEKKVAEKAPVDEIKMDDLSNWKSSTDAIQIVDNKKYILLISDFYYLESANNLKKVLINKTKFDIFSVKKLKKNKYRLTAGPVKDFKSLKSVYISLNKLGFEDLIVNKQ